MIVTDDGEPNDEIEHSIHLVKLVFIAANDSMQGLDTK